MEPTPLGAERNAGPDARRIALLVLLVTAIAAALRLPNISTDSIWYDEGATWAQVNGSPLEVILRTARDTYPPAYNVLAWVTFNIFGQTEVGLRLPATILGVLTIPLTYWTVSAVGRPAGGLFAALLVALSPISLLYSLDARPYSLMLFASTWHLGAILWAENKAPRRVYVGVFCSAVLLLYAHPFGSLEIASISATLAALAIMLPSRRRQFVALLAAEIVAVLAFLPWASILAGVAKRLTTDGFWIDRPTPGMLLAYLQTVAGGPLLGPGLLALVIFGLVMKARWRGDVPARASSLWLALAVAVGPTLIGFVISQVTTPILIPRYMIGTLPGILALAAVPLSNWSIDSKRYLAAIVAVLGLASVALTREPTRHVEDWRGLAHDLSLTPDQQYCLLGNRSAVRALSFYMPRPTCVVTDLSDESVTHTFQIASRVLILDSHIANRLDQITPLFPTGSHVETRDYGNVHLLIVTTTN